MRLLLTLLLPWLQSFTIGRPIADIIYLILQLTLIGWVPAIIWSVYASSQYKTDQKVRNALGAADRRQGEPVSRNGGIPLRTRRFPNVIRPAYFPDNRQHP